MTEKRVLGYLSAAPRVSTRPDAELSGARTHVLGVMHAFQNLGWEVRPFIVGDRIPRTWSGQGSEKAIRGGGLRTLAADLLRLSLGLINARRAWRELGGDAGTGPPVDWVYERAASLQSLGGRFSRHGIPWILETNAPLFYEARQERKTVLLASLARRLELHAYRRCDVLVCVSNQLKTIIVREAGIPASKVVVVPNAVDTDLFDPDRTDAERVFPGFTVGFVGGLAHWQRLDLLLDVIHDLKNDGICVYLVVVGDGASRPDLERKVEALGLVVQVKFVGPVPGEEVPRYLAGFDIGYSGQMSLSIGVMYLSPLKLYEYMAMAKPVLASDFADARRLVVESETGYLFRPGDRDSLRAKLLEAYTNRTQLAAMGRTARDQIVRHHTWASRVSSLIGAVEAIL